jgi:hypothetical protein
MTVLGTVDVANMAVAEGSVLAAYVGDELRGRAVAVPARGTAAVELWVEVAADGELLTFRLWDAAKDMVLEPCLADGEIATEIGGTAGTPRP